MIKLPIYKLFIQEDEFLQVALVDFPAIEENFLMFNNELIKMTFDADKKIISGPVMIPDQLIYRNGIKDGSGEHYVYYDNETVIKAATLFLKNGMKFNKMHDNKVIKSINVIESYITKSDNQFGVPEGSWVITARVEDDEIWKQIKAGEFNGFSFQSLVGYELQDNFNKTQETYMKEEFKMKIMDAVNKILFGEDAIITSVEPIIAPITAPVAEPVIVVEPVVEAVVEPVIAPIVEPVVPITEPIVEPIVLTEDKVNELLVASQTETITKLEGMIKVLSDKLDAFGNTPIKTTKEIEEVENPKSSANPYSKYFQKK